MDIFVQAHFSMLSFLRRMAPEDRIVVVTDHPASFVHYPMVETVEVDDDAVEKWKGRHQFFWRAKIKAMEKVCELYPNEDLLYLDCDTFLFGDLTEMKRRVKEGTGFMDGCEGHPSTIKYKPQRMYKVVGGKAYGGITVSDKHCMWCAGVVGIPCGRKAEVVGTALSLCDGMLDDGAEPIVIEQYALSIAMFEKTSLASSKPYIGHYWGNKPQWIEMAQGVFLQALFTSANIDDEIKMFEQIPLEKIPVHIKSRNTNRRLKGLVDKLFPDGKETFIEQ